MNYIDFENIFSQENIERYRGYFNVPKVVEQANKIEGSVRSTKELTQEENIASALLAYIMLNQQN